MSEPIQQPVIGATAPEDLRKVLRQTLDSGNIGDLKAVVRDEPASVVVRAIEELTNPECVVVLRVLPEDRQVEVFNRLSPTRQNRLLHSFSEEQTRDLLQELSPDDRTELFEDLPANLTQRLLNMLEPEELTRARELLGYPEESLGRLMTPEFISVRPDWTVGRALNHVQNLGDRVETTKLVFVTYDNQLIDTVTRRDLLTAEEDTTVEQLLDGERVTASPYTDREEAVRMMQEQGLTALPVVNDLGKLLGIVTLDDVTDVQQEETTEDFQRFGASEPLEGAYWEVSLFHVARQRMGWLLFLFVGGGLTSAVIGQFEALLESALILSLFIPLLIGSAGNAGTQSVSTIIRALSLDEVGWQTIPRVMLKESLVGFLMGLGMGALGFLFAQFYWGAGPRVSLVVALTLPAIIVWTTFFAGVLPILAQRLNLDPTLMSAPLITTFADATGLLIYFTMARFILGL